jgi:hypothetical protein
MAEQDKRTEEFSVNGEEVVSKVKELLKEVDVRRIIIKNEKGETVVELPVSIGLIGALIAPMLAAVGAAAALLTKCTIIVERRD